MLNVNKVQLLSERTSGVPPVIFYQWIVGNIYNHTASTSTKATQRQRQRHKRFQEECVNVHRLKFPVLLYVGWNYLWLMTLLEDKDKWWYRNTLQNKIYSMQNDWSGEKKLEQLICSLYMVFFARENYGVIQTISRRSVIVLIFESPGWELHVFMEE